MASGSDGHGHGHGHGHDHDHDHDHEHDHEGLAAGTGRVVHLDCFSGIAGDMTLAGLLDAGVPIEVVEERLRRLPVRGWRIVTRRVERSGIAALGLDVEIDPRQPERTWPSIRTMLEAADLPDGARARALAIFARLAHAEAHVHRVALEAVHFHEVGAVDAIVDVCGTAIALDWLGARVSSTPVPHGRGFVKARHGTLPLPSPASLEALAGVPVYGVDVQAEIVTPTGASIVGALAEWFGTLPPMRIERIGWGAGTQELADRPNLLRVIVGHPEPARHGALVVLEANVDDMSPEIAGWLLERLLGAGALDAWLAPIQMKKGRPAVMVGVLVREADRSALESLLLAESTSLGVRSHGVERRELARRREVVQTRFGAIDVKVATDGAAHNAAPEFDSCRAAAERHGVPLKQVFAEAIAAYWRDR